MAHPIDCRALLVVAATLVGLAHVGAGVRRPFATARSALRREGSSVGDAARGSQSPEAPVSLGLPGVGEAAMGSRGTTGVIERMKRNPRCPSGAPCPSPAPTANHTALMHQRVHSAPSAQAGSNRSGFAGKAQEGAAIQPDAARASCTKRNSTSTRRARGVQGRRIDRIANGGGRRRGRPPGETRAALLLCRHPEGCTRSASFGEANSEIRLFCALHRQTGHEDKKHKPCSVRDCHRQGSYRRADGSGERVCATHCDSPRVTAAGVRCIIPTCSAEATHAPAISRTDTAGAIAGSSMVAAVDHRQASPRSRRACATWCAAHRPENAVDVRKHVCVVDSCERRATHGELGFAPIVCSQHRRSGFVDRRHKRCQFLQSTGQGTRDNPAREALHGAAARDGRAPVSDKVCQRQPSFGDPEEGVARFCAQHREPWHVDVRSRRCQAPGCGRTASFGIAATGHGSRGRRCIALDKMRRGSSKGPLFCHEHKAPAHVNLKAAHRRNVQHWGAGAGADKDVTEILFRDSFATVTLVREAALPAGEGPEGAYQLPETRFGDALAP